MNFVYTHALELIQSGSFDWESADVRLILLGNTSTAGDDEDAEVINDIDTLGEVEGSGYTRKVIANASVSLDEDTDTIIWTADPVVYSGLNVGYIYASMLYLHVNDDTDSIPLLYVDNKFSITAAAPAESGDTTIYVDPLPSVLHAGDVLTFPNAVQVTISSGASAGARQLSVEAIPDDIALAAQAQSPARIFPIATNGGQLKITLGNIVEIRNG